MLFPSHPYFSQGNSESNTEIHLVRRGRFGDSFLTQVRSRRRVSSSCILFNSVPSLFPLSSVWRWRPSLLLCLLFLSCRTSWSIVWTKMNERTVGSCSALFLFRERCRMKDAADRNAPRRSIFFVPSGLYLVRLQISGFGEGGGQCFQLRFL